MHLVPLRGMPLETLNCAGTGVADLSPLEGCKRLRFLDVEKTNVNADSIAWFKRTVPGSGLRWDGAPRASGLFPAQPTNTDKPEANPALKFPPPLHVRRPASGSRFITQSVMATMKLRN